MFIDPHWRSSSNVPEVAQEECTILMEQRAGESFSKSKGRAYHTFNYVSYQGFPLTLHLTSTIESMGALLAPK